MFDGFYHIPYFFQTPNPCGVFYSCTVSSSPSLILCCPPFLLDELCDSYILAICACARLFLCNVAIASFLVNIVSHFKVFSLTFMISLCSKVSTIPPNIGRKGFNALSNSSALRYMYGQVLGVPSMFT